MQVTSAMLAITYKVVVALITWCPRWTAGAIECLHISFPDLWIFLVYWTIIPSGECIYMEMHASTLLLSMHYMLQSLCVIFQNNTYTRCKPAAIYLYCRLWCCEYYTISASCTKCNCWVVLWTNLPLQ